jgi:hypothetical protein
LIKDKKYKRLLGYDQLNIDGFDEGNINFDPTSRFKEGKYDNSTVPAWC